MPPTEADDDDPRERDESGRVVETVTPDRVLDAVHAVIEEEEQPFVTVREVAEVLDVSGESARRKLTRLADEGRVDRKKVGARAVAWWPTDEDGDGSASDRR